MANDVTSKVILGLDPSEFRRNIQKVDASLKQTGKLMGNLGQAIGAAFVVSQVQAFASEAIKLGSELQTVGRGFARFGNEMQLEQLRKSTRGLVTDLELMKVTVQAGNFGIPIEQMGKLLEFATKRAAETGQSVDYLVNSIVTGIGRKSPLILDNLGISVVRLKEKFGGVALEAQSIADVAKAVGEIATDELGKMGESVDTAADKMQRLNTSWTNWKTSVGESLAGPLAEFLDWTVETAKYFNLLMKVMNQLSTFGARKAFGIKMGGGAAPAAPTGGGGAPTPQAPVRSISLLRENLEALKKEFEVVEIGSARFNELKIAIENANKQIERATTVYWDGAKESTIELNDKGLKPVTNELTYQDMVLRSSIIPAYDEFTSMVKGAKDQLEQMQQQMQAAAAFGAEFGSILSGAFTAAMNNGTSFFDEIGNAIRNYVQQMATALATTAALSVLFSAITGTPLNVAFAGISQGMGLGNFFGEGGMFNLKATVSGSDLQLGTNRASRNFTRSGGG